MQRRLLRCPLEEDIGEELRSTLLRMLYPRQYYGDCSA